MSIPIEKGTLVSISIEKGTIVSIPIEKCTIVSSLGGRIASVNMQDGWDTAVSSPARHPFVEAQANASERSHSPSNLAS